MQTIKLHSILKFTAVAIIACVAVIWAWSTPNGHYKLQHITQAESDYVIEQVQDVPVSTSEGMTSTESLHKWNVTLEWRLMETKQEDGYEVETYQEYELYKDASQRVVKEIPTENYQYLKYWIEEK